jgi:hypothetical protein
MGQLITQRPPVQISPAAHAVPHIPQLARSVCTSRQLPLQLVRLMAQVTAHMPIEHTCPPAHAVSHIPQWAISFCRLMQVPLQLL